VSRGLRVTKEKLVTRDPRVTLVRRDRKAMLDQKVRKVRLDRRVRQALREPGGYRELMAQMERQALTELRASKAPRETRDRLGNRVPSATRDP
jgi:hypothetical protein